jgi:WD40 repeat protein
MVHSVSISVDCTTIASGSFDKTVRLWDTQTGECHHIIKQQVRVYSMKFSPTDPQYFLFMSNHKIWQWNISGHQVGPTFEGIGYVIFPQMVLKLFHAMMGVATVQNTSSGAVVTTFPVVTDEQHRCCFSPDGRLIAVSAGRIAHVWDITGSEPHLIETFIGHTDQIHIPCIFLPFFSHLSIFLINQSSSGKLD